MKHVMKSLKHNGIFVPIYDYKGFNIKINGQTVKLTPKERADGGCMGKKNIINRLAARPSFQT